MIALRTAPVLILLALAACGDPGAEAAPDQGGDPSAQTSAAPRRVGTGQIELLTFSKLQGLAEAVPCNPAAASPLASAARSKAALRAQGGADVRLICVGDSLRQTATITSTKAAIAGAEARDDVILDAMAAAGVDMYVPSFGDFAGGVSDLFDRCAERGLPVVISNMEVEGRDDVLPYLIFENGGLRIAALGAIPTEAPQGKQRLDEPGVSIAKPVRRLQTLSEELLEQGLADIIVVFSAMPSRVNHRLCDVSSVHFIIGTTDRGMAAGRIVHRHDSWLMNQEFNGHELGHTTIRVVDGDFRMADLSGRYFLPEQLLAEEAALDIFEQQFGTRDLTQLARYLSPGREQEFLDKYALLDENRAWLEEVADYAGSYVAHRIEPFESDPPGDPVVAVLDGQAAAIKAAVSRIAAEPSDVDPYSPISKPESCQECHQAQYDHWRDTGHSRAYELLVEVGRENDTSCLVCHAAGYAAAGGFADPRVGAPFGGHTCWNCHATESYHAELIRGATDPAFIGIREPAPMMEYCENCHSEDRSPGFDLERAMERVTCPQTRFDDPTLTLVRGRVLSAIERQRENGTSEPRDLYREGRALVGLGRVEEGLTALHAFLAGIEPTNAAYVPQHIEVARFLDDLGRSQEGIDLVRSLLADHQGDPGLHMTYIEMLLEANDPEARDPAWAASYLDMVAPIEPGKRFESEELSIRLLQVRALFEGGRPQEGYQLLQGLNASFARNERIQELLDRYLAPPR